MIRSTLLTLACAVALALNGCASTSGQPVMSMGSIMPSDLMPDETAIITVEIQDKFDVVRKVEGVVKEDRTLTFKLRDDGMPPDHKAKDGIWTVQVDVPFNAPPGEFEFEITGYSDEGEVIVVHDENDEAAPLSTSFGLVIQYPQESSETLQQN